MSIQSKSKMPPSASVTVASEEVMHVPRHAIPSLNRAWNDPVDPISWMSEDSCPGSSCSRAVTASLPRADARRAAGRCEADRAMNWLAKAVAAGYQTPENVAHMTRDPDLDALRGRADFRRLLAGLFDRGVPADPFAR